MQYIVERVHGLRRLSLRVKKDGSVIVRSPRLVPEFVIARFVESSHEWIKQQQEKLALSPILLSARQVLYFGVTYTVKVSSKKDGTIRFVNDTCIVAPFSLTGVSVKNSLMTHIKHAARDYIVMRLPVLARRMDCTYTALRFGQQKTRWGSCSSRKSLQFNWRLAHAPKEVIDYVIIHELAHTKEMNHGKKFWELVEKYDPDFRLHKRYLQKIGGVEE